MLGQFIIQMTPFGRERKVRVYLPGGYDDATEAYPVLYMHDGQNLYRDADASFGTSWSIADHLDQTARGLIVVGIDCSQEGFGRLNEYSPWVNPTVGQELLGVNEPFGGDLVGLLVQPGRTGGADPAERSVGGGAVLYGCRHV